MINRNETMKELLEENLSEILVKDLFCKVAAIRAG